jgi:hypothetical protein
MEFELDPEIAAYMREHDVDEIEAANELGIPFSDIFDRVDNDD